MGLSTSEDVETMNSGGASLRASVYVAKHSVAVAREAIAGGGGAAARPGVAGGGCAGDSGSVA